MGHLKRQCLGIPHFKQCQSVCSSSRPHVCYIGCPRICSLGWPHVCSLGCPRVWPHACCLGWQHICYIGCLHVCDIGCLHVCYIDCPHVSSFIAYLSAQLVAHLTAYLPAQHASHMPIVREKYEKMFERNTSIAKQRHHQKMVASNLQYIAHTQATPTVLDHFTKVANKPLSPRCHEQRAVQWRLAVLSIAVWCTKWLATCIVIVHHNACRV